MENLIFPGNPKYPSEAWCDKYYRDKTLDDKSTFDLFNALADC